MSRSMIRRATYLTFIGMATQQHDGAWLFQPEGGSKPTEGIILRKQTPNFHLLERVRNHPAPRLSPHDERHLALGGDPRLQIRLARQQYGLSQWELAIKAQISRNYLCRIETRQQMPRPAILARLLHALDTLPCIVEAQHTESPMPQQGMRLDLRLDFPRPLSAKASTPSLSAHAYY